MSDLLNFCLESSLMMVAIHVCFWQGNILFHAGNAVRGLFYRFNIPDFFLKPLFDCLVCMSSVYGLLFWLINGLNYHPIAVVLVCAGINSIVGRFVYELPDAKELPHNECSLKREQS